MTPEDKVKVASETYTLIILRGKSFIVHRKAKIDHFKESINHYKH